MKIHIVKKGESLYSLSQKYGVSLDTLISMNPQLSDPNKLDVGMKVKVPSTVHSTGGYEIVHKHVVKEGDTMWKLAKAWGIPLQAMIAANPQLKNPNVFLIGQVVNIPKVTTEQLQAQGQLENHSNEQGSVGLQSGKGGVLPGNKAAATSPKPKHELLKPKAEVTQPQAPPVVPPTPVAPAKPSAPAPSVTPQAKAKPAAPTPISPSAKGSNQAPTPISPSAKGSNQAPTPISPSAKGSNQAPTPISPSAKGSNQAPTPISPSAKGSNQAPTPISPSAKGSNQAPTPISPSAKGSNQAPTPILPSAKGSNSAPAPFAANASVLTPSSFPASQPQHVDNGGMGLTYEQFTVQYPMTPVPCNPYNFYPTDVHPSMTCGPAVMHGYPGSVGGIGNAVPGYMPTGMPAGGPSGICEPNYQPYDCYNPYAAPVLPAHAVIEPANPLMTAHIQSVQSTPLPYQPVYSVPDAGQWYGHGVNPEQTYMPYGNASANGNQPELSPYSQHNNQAYQSAAGGVPRQEDDGVWGVDHPSVAVESGAATSTKKKTTKKEYKATKKKAKVRSVETSSGSRSRKQSTPWING
ncbi:LysM peptidoglycan-binding domain-containing protein [Paenibacillus taiwanensis]|uniref:LysM peptidoglycan-binding domain-containing protein n=1 Tax=Paenibacillus taiwanensis TaxID=401638 RepID=UPI000422F105|nr:LysM peptidoglycan-binding domain-containing protein [Paenibacillus taiwanensis]